MSGRGKLNFASLMRCRADSRCASIVGLRVASKRSDAYAGRPKIPQPLVAQRLLAPKESGASSVIGDIQELCKHTDCYAAFDLTRENCSTEAT